MKNAFLKKLISCFISLALVFCTLPKCECKGLADKFFGAVSHLFGGNSENKDENSDSDDEGNENEFNFIKSGNSDDNFLYNGNWLLYGGIILIIVSITGMVITLKPKKSKHKRAHRR